VRALILTAFFIAGCGNPPPKAEPPPLPGAVSTEGTVIMTVDGQPVTQEMVDAVTRRIPPQQLEQMKATGKYAQFEERMAVGQVLYNQAIERKLHEDDGVQMALAMSQRDVLAAELLDVVGAEAVTDEKLKEGYEKRAVQFKRPQVQARHILVKEKTLADEIFAKLGAGGDFAALAQEHSTDPGSKVKGGDLGWFEKGRMVAPFSDAAFAAEKNVVIGPVESRYGFHVIEVLDKRDSIPFEEVRERLEQELKQEAVTAHIEGVKSSYKVEQKGATATDGATTADTPAAPPAPAHGAGDGHGH